MRARFAKERVNVTSQRKRIIGTRATREQSEMSHQGLGLVTKGSEMTAATLCVVDKTRPHPPVRDSSSLLTMPLVAKKTKTKKHMCASQSGINTAFLYRKNVGKNNLNEKINMSLNSLKNRGFQSCR